MFHDAWEILRRGPPRLRMTSGDAVALSGRYLLTRLFLLIDCVRLLLFAALGLLGTTVAGFAQLAPSPINEVILEQVKKMPSGGNYSASRTATIRLQSAAHFESGKFFVLPAAASPSYCSGATYLVFMKTIEALRERGDLSLNYATLEQLMIRGQRDGAGIWGRWNANGPGTARLFYSLGIGRNFDDFEEAQRGDFMKIFWSPEVGFGDLSRDGKKARARICAFLVEQHSIWLWRKERPAKQDRARDFLAALFALQPDEDRNRASTRQLPCESRAGAFELRRGEGRVRDVIPPNDPA